MSYNFGIPCAIAGWLIAAWAAPAFAQERADSTGFDEAMLRRILVQYSDLVDPFSVQFRKVWKKTRFSWCGELNAKNQLGGYVGWRRFWVTAVDPTEGAYIAIEDDAWPHRGQIIANSCGPAPPDSLPVTASANSGWRSTFLHLSAPRWSPAVGAW